jgi:hypothetical protein
MGTIYDTVMVLGQSAAKKRAKQDEELKGQTYGVAAKAVGEKGYVVHPDGTRTELCTLEALEEREDWASVTVSYDDNGERRKMTFTIAGEDIGGSADSEDKPATRYPSVVFTASGKLVHLAV